MSAPKSVNEEIKSIVVAHEADRSDALQFAKTYRIANEKQFSAAGRVLDRIALCRKTIEERVEKITKPLYQAWQAALDLKRPAVKDLNEAEELVKAEITRYMKWRNAEQERKLAAAAKAKDTKAIAEVADQTTTAPSGTSAKGRWLFRILTPQKVPDKFCVKTPNCRLIELAIEEGVREIPGVEIYHTIDVRRTGHRKKEDHGE